MNSRQQLVVASTSRASDGGYLALADVAEIAEHMKADHRIVGGHMVTLLVEACGASERVLMRETVDVDFGAMPEVISDSRLPDALRAKEYRASEAANRFSRRVDDQDGGLNLIVDVLAPSFQASLVPNQQHGDLVVDEIPGLSLALARDPVHLDLQVRLLNGRVVPMVLRLPDVASALCIKALAYRSRAAHKDEMDIWRLMNAYHAAGLDDDAWPTSPTFDDAAEILVRYFGRTGASGLKRMSREEQARMRVMVKRALATDGS